MKITEIIQQAKDYILENGEYQPTLFFELSDDETGMAIFADFPSTTHKKQVHLFNTGRQIGMQYLGKEIKSLCFICEAWLSIRKIDEQVNYAPSMDPNRKEVLIAQTMIVNGENLTQRVQTIEMLRDGAGNLVDLLLHSKSEECKSMMLPAFLSGFIAGRMSDEDLANFVMQYTGQKGERNN